MPRYVTLKLCPAPAALLSPKHQLCLMALLYDHEVAALKTCLREVTELPVSPTAVYLGNSIYLFCVVDEQQFFYNITYSDGKKFSTSVSGCKSCLVYTPCHGKLPHPTNGFVMLPDPRECVEPTRSITTISTPEVLNAVFTIPTNLQTNEQQSLTLHMVRAELQGGPTLEVTPQLNKEQVGKIQTHYKTDGSKELRFQPSWQNTIQEMAGLFALLYECWASYVRLFG